MKKLVRDRIPFIIASSGRKPDFEVLGPSEIKPFVAAKLQEELDEVLAAKTHEERAKEIADLLEVLQKYARVHDIDWSKVLFEKESKNGKAGAFRENIVLEIK